MRFYTVCGSFCSKFRQDFFCPQIFCVCLMKTINLNLQNEQNRTRFRIVKFSCKEHKCEFTRGFLWDACDAKTNITECENEQYKDIINKLYKQKLSITVIEI